MPDDAFGQHGPATAEPWVFEGRPSRGAGSALRLRESDLRGFLGISPEVRNGYNAIRVRMRVKTQAHPSAIKALTAMSPVFDTVSRSVPITVDIETY